MKLRHGLILALALVLAPAAAAQAQEPAFKGTLNGSTPKFTWESSGSGAPEQTGLLRCIGGPFHCDYILFNVEAAGELALTLDSTEGQGASGVPLICETEPCASYQDLDGYLYKSDASGAPQGDTLTNGDAEAGEPDCVSSFASESCKVKVEPGFYVLEVEFFAAIEAPYTGTAELLGVAAPAAPAADAPAAPAEPQQPAQPQQQPAQSQQPAEPHSAEKPKKKSSAKKRRAACTKKAKKIKNKGKRKKALKRCKKIR